MNAMVQHVPHAPERQETRIASEEAGDMKGREMHRVVCACGNAGAFYWSRAEAAMSWLNHATRQLDVVTLKPMKHPPIDRGQAIRMIASYL